MLPLQRENKTDKTSSLSRWYDLIAKLYDYGSVWSYKKPRETLVQKMNFKSGDRVLLVGCGTGLIFSYLQNKLNGSGQIIGIDASKGMLRQAKKKIDKYGWTNIHLVHADARKLSLEFIHEQFGDERLFDLVIGELSFSVMPDWQLIMQNSINLLKAGGSFGVLDGHRKKQDAMNTMLNFLPRSDISRPISEYAESLTENYSTEFFGVGQIIFVGVGQKADRSSGG